MRLECFYLLFPCTVVQGDEGARIPIGADLIDGLSDLLELRTHPPIFFHNFQITMSDFTPHS